MGTVSTDAAVRGAALPITIYVNGVDLETATDIKMVFARTLGSTPELTKTKSGGHITVTYDAENSRSVLTLALADSETVNWRREVQFAIYVDDGTTGGYWTDAANGVGSIRFTDAVQRA